MHIAILGRQPALGMAELERIYGTADTKWFSDESAVVATDDFDFNRLGGCMKAGRVVLQLNGGWGDVSHAIIEHYLKAWDEVDHKMTLGLSAYGFKTTARDVQKTGIILKQRLKKELVNIRLIPNEYPALNTAASHHNKLGLAPNKVELLIVRAGNGAVIVAESVGAQNISAIAARDQARPHTDAFVGMLPPKLARIMVNLSGLTPDKSILDPFCGTGVILQEALLDGFTVNGTDLSEKMVDYTTKNLEWFKGKARPRGKVGTIRQGDAMDHLWEMRVDAVVSEAYLGQPFSAPPRPEKLTEVRGNCNHIISTFLANAARQFNASTPFVLAVPAWRDSKGNFTHLPLTGSLLNLGFERVKLKNVRNEELLYFRENQVVARELLILVKK
jgi:tRNA (guanine10-N2)-dimethyltransferase